MFMVLLMLQDSRQVNNMKIAFLSFFLFSFSPFFNEKAERVISVMQPRSGKTNIKKGLRDKENRCGGVEQGKKGVVDFTHN